MASRMQPDRQERFQNLAFADPLAEAAAKCLETAAAVVWLLDKAGAELVLTAGYGLPASIERCIALSSNPIEGQALTTGKAAAKGAADDPAATGLPPGFAAALAVPLGNTESASGVLCVYDREPRRFTEAETQHLRLLAGLGALLLDLQLGSDEQAAKLQTLESLEVERSRLTRVTTHQLRSPITITQSLLRNLLKGYAGPISDQQRDILGRIANQLDFLSHMVDDFLELAASKAPVPADQEGPTSVNLSVARVSLVLQPRAEEKGVSLTLRKCREELVVWGTEEGLDAIFQNLVDNAVKYTPQGGQVTVSLERRGDEAKITIADTGIGIPEESLAHLFDEFYRAPNARATAVVGTGLGLAIVKGLVDRFRGRVTVQSAAGAGATFTVVLPLHEPAR